MRQCKLVVDIKKWVDIKEYRCVYIKLVHACWENWQYALTMQDQIRENWNYDLSNKSKFNIFPAVKQPWLIKDQMTYPQKHFRPLGLSMWLSKRINKSSWKSDEKHMFLKTFLASDKVLLSSRHGKWNWDWLIFSTFTFIMDNL